MFWARTSYHRGIIQINCEMLAINKLAKTGQRGDPIITPSIWSLWVIMKLTGCRYLKIVK